MQVVRAALELPDDKLAGDTFNPQKSGRHPREVDSQAVAGFPTPCLLPHSLGGSEKGRKEKHQPGGGGGRGRDQPRATQWPAPRERLVFIPTENPVSDVAEVTNSRGAACLP